MVKSFSHKKSLVCSLALRPPTLVISKRFSSFFRLLDLSLILNQELLRNKKWAHLFIRVLGKCLRLTDHFWGSLNEFPTINRDYYQLKTQINLTQENTKIITALYSCNLPTRDGFSRFVCRDRLTLRPYWDGLGEAILKLASVAWVTTFWLLDRPNLDSGDCSPALKPCRMVPISIPLVLSCLPSTMFQLQLTRRGTKSRTRIKYFRNLKLNTVIRFHWKFHLLPMYCQRIVDGLGKKDADKQKTTTHQYQ